MQRSNRTIVEQDPDPRGTGPGSRGQPGYGKRREARPRKGGPGKRNPSEAKPGQENPKAAVKTCGEPQDYVAEPGPTQRRTRDLDTKRGEPRTTGPQHVWRTPVFCLKNPDTPKSQDILRTLAFF